MKRTLPLLILLFIFSCDTTIKPKYIINPQNNVVSNYTKSEEINKITFFALEKLKISNVKISIVYIPDFLVKEYYGETNSKLEGFIVEPAFNTYQILINSNLDDVNIRRVMFHEIIHLKQSHSGRLITCNNKSAVFNMKSYPDLDMVPYNLRPWEIEAFLYQKTLVSYYNLYE